VGVGGDREPESGMEGFQAALVRKKCYYIQCSL